MDKKITSSVIDVEGDADAVNDHFHANLWTDGHPVIPPTRDLLKRYLDAIPHDAQLPIAVVQPREGVATVEKIAINAIMAGCKPSYLPVVLAAVKAVASDPNQGSMLGMAHSLSPLVIVCGPIVEEIGLQSGEGGSSASWQANAAIARALRLCLINIGGVAGSTDSNTFMWLVKYNYAIVENLPQSPWPSLATNHGYTAEDNVVLVYWKEPPHHLEVNWPVTAAGLLDAFCDSMCTVASHASYGTGQNALVGLCPDHARMCADAGLSKDDVKHYITENARIPANRFGRDAIRHFPKKLKDLVGDDPDAMVPMITEPGQIELMVTGGAGANSLFFPYGFGPFAATI